MLLFLWSIFIQWLSFFDELQTAHSRYSVFTQRNILVFLFKIEGINLTPNIFPQQSTNESQDGRFNWIISFQSKILPRHWHLSTSIISKWSFIQFDKLDFPNKYHTVISVIDIGYHLCRHRWLYRMHSFTLYSVGKWKTLGHFLRIVKDSSKEVRA